jgi:antibiotic biosynthesis monooxygenase (ABM) superfamily enzyme
MKRLDDHSWLSLSSSLVNSNSDKAHTAPPPPPPQYKMAIVMTGIIFVLLNILIPVIRQLTIGLPNLLSTLVGVAIMVLLMTYVIMPLLTKLLRPWLTEKRFF